MKAVRAAPADAPGPQLLPLTLVSSICTACRHTHAYTSPLFHFEQDGREGDSPCLSTPPLEGGGCTQMRLDNNVFCVHLCFYYHQGLLCLLGRLMERLAQLALVPAHRHHQFPCATANTH